MNNFVITVFLGKVQLQNSGLTYNNRPMWASPHSRSKERKDRESGIWTMNIYVCGVVIVAFHSGQLGVDHPYAHGL